MKKNYQIHKVVKINVTYTVKKWGGWLTFKCTIFFLFVRYPANFRRWKLNDVGTTGEKINLNWKHSFFLEKVFFSGQIGVHRPNISKCIEILCHADIFFILKHFLIIFATEVTLLRTVHWVRQYGYEIWIFPLQVPTLFMFIYNLLYAFNKIKSFQT